MHHQGWLTVVLEHHLKNSKNFKNSKIFETSRKFKKKSKIQNVSKSKYFSKSPKIELNSKESGRPKFTFLAPQPRFTLIAEGSCKTLVLLVMYRSPP